MPSGSGGILGDLIEKFLMSAISGTGTTIFLLIGILSGLTLCLHISWFKVADAIGYVILLAVAKLWRQIPKLSWSKARSSEKASYLSDEKEDLLEVRPMLRAPSVLPRKNIPSQEENLVSFAPKKAEQKAEKVEKTPNSKPVSRSLSRGEEVLLSLDLLNQPQHLEQNTLSSTELTMLSQEVEQRLMDFGIKVDVVGAHPGPVITRFELLPAPGVKASRISNLATDLARSLSVVRVRIVEVIPGKSVVGLEIPNRVRETVYLKEVLESRQYQEAKSAVSLALGKDIAGHPVVVDLAKCRIYWLQAPLDLVSQSGSMRCY